MKRNYLKRNEWGLRLLKLTIQSLFGLVLLFVGFAATAQEQVITGRIIDAETKESIPGATILVKGTQNGAISDLDGNFRLQIGPDDEQVLVVAFVGYKSQEVSVIGRSTVEVSLMMDVAALEEVVVVGYGTQKKALNTGANLKVSGEDIQKLSTTNALQGLQGQTPGVQLSSTSGQPGSGMRVVIRGAGSLSGSGPLYVVDGVLTGDVSYLNPADIASVDILKDAASAAIYGSQAANGVVLITTKKGKAGQSRVTFDSYYGVQNVARKADMLNAREYATIMNEAAINSGKVPYFSNAEIDSLAANANTNWMDQMFVENAVTQNYALGFSGGTETSNFSTSLSYTGQEGIVGGAALSNYERYGFRINSEKSMFDGFLTIGENLTFAYTNSNGVGVGNQYNNTLRAAFNTSPFLPMYDSLGNFYDNSNSTWYNGESNPYAAMVYNNQNENNGQKLLGNIYAELKPIKGLSIKTRLGVDYYANEGHSFSPEYQLSIYSFRNYTEVSQSMSKGRSLLWDNWASYDVNIAKHGLGFMVGSSMYQFQGSSMYTANRDAVFSDLEHAYINNTTNTNGANISINGTGDNPDNRLSYFARVNYNFNEKYLLNATFRADGSSRFAEGNQWGYFPSVSAGWVATEEGFLKSNNVIRFLKVRASWGQVGNQNVGAYQYLAPIATMNTNYVFGVEEGALTPGAYPSRLSNPNLQWETAEQLNVGFDSRLINGGLNLSVDWYKKTNKDWLIVAPVLATAGADAPYINGGDVINTGIEMALTYNSNFGDLYYTVGVNGSYNQNEVGEIPTSDGIIHGASNQLFDNSLEFYRAQSGFPIGYFWGLETDGIFQNEAEVAAHSTGEGLIQPDAQPGDVRYIDQNNDGIINDNDRIELGNPNPDFIFGFNIALDYKGLDFSILGSGVAGNQIVQSYRNHANQYANYTSEVLNRWHGEGTSNTMPRVTENSSNWLQFSDLYVKDGDYLRISNITVGYDFKNLVPGEKFGKLRLYASVLNAFTFTNYTGMDPEIGYGIDNGETDRFSSGIDLGYYPRPRTIMVGLNVSF
ncbi:MAG: SusC/RagA family TonB-linked outer membrane protein [Flammeovirgaceae bacterium]|nr:SusC/RagA family TonB-linked outer membrane protein [Flammeovirgaceae bacterium]|tara:strand:- start:1444 stop:4587 length:3144 start_codon:yes stop_codon:yes gene_type:complete